MPHLTLEYSSNVIAESDLVALFSRLHDVLAKTGGVKVENCKSRAYVASDFLAGSVGEVGGFVHLDIRLLDGRSPEIKRSIGQETLDILREWFQLPVDTLDLQLTVEVRDIDRTYYFKFPEGTFTPL